MENSNQNTENTEIAGNGIVNAIQRLTRAGNEGSKTVQKLKDATYEAASFIAEQLDSALDWDKSGGCQKGDLLRWGEILEEYELHIYWLWCDGMYEKPILQKGNCCLNATKVELEQIGNILLRDTTRADALAFSDDIANGLLEKVAAYIEERNKKSISALETLEKKNQE